MDHNISACSQIIQALQQRTGLKFDDRRMSQLLKYIEQHPLTASLLWQTLQQEPDSSPMWQALIQQVTIGETYFFRNVAHFEALRHHILPDLIARRRQENRLVLRLWSAGCATGEEPYSLAMLLHDLLPDIEDWTIYLLGTDINGGYLQAARQGNYSANAFRNETPDYLKGRWFHQQGKLYLLSPVIKQMVTFTTCNLTTLMPDQLPLEMTHFDVILCRNVTIYFDQEQTRQLIQTFHAALTDCGWLVVGHAEPHPELYQGFETNSFHNTVVYRRQTPVPQAVPVSAATRTAVVPPQPPPIPVHRQAKRSKAEKLTVQDLMQHARDCADKEEWQMALTYLRQIEAVDMFYAPAHYLRGVILREMNDTAASLASLRRAIYCDPNFVLAHYTLGDLYAGNQQYRRAQRIWRQAQRLLVDQPLERVLPPSPDITVGMLTDLLQTRLN